MRLLISALSALALSSVASAQCMTTHFNSSSILVGPTEWGMFFDLTTTEVVTITSMEINMSQAGQSVGARIHISPSTYAGNEGNPAAWTLIAMDDGTSISQGANLPTVINFTSPWIVPAGTWGIAVEYLGASPYHALGSQVGNTFTDGTLTIDAGTWASPPVQTGATVLPDRIFSGSLCYSLGGNPGTSYCGPAQPNSTGFPATITADGSPLVVLDTLTLNASGLPAGQFGYFLAGQTQGLFNPAGSQGFICLSGNIGRFNQAPQIITGPTGSLTVDLTAIPVNPPQAVQAGETWNFQCWYRDNNPISTSNFSDGLSVTFE